MTKLILASGSTGRKSLLEALNLKFEVVESNINEEKIQDIDPVKLAIKRAEAKASAVAAEIRNSKFEIRKNEEILIIGADTVGFMDKWVFGKPKSRKEAEEILQKLSGKTHSYVSAHCVLKILKPENPKIQNPNSSIVLPFYSSVAGYDISSVTFKKLSKEDIKFYLDHVEYLKLCGAFKLSNSPQNFVVGIEGSISNIIGLSLEKIIPILKENFLL